MDSGFLRQYDPLSWADKYHAITYWVTQNEMIRTTEYYIYNVS